jgi:hypothetical protein
LLDLEQDLNQITKLISFFQTDDSYFAKYCLQDARETLKHYEEMQASGVVEDGEVSSLVV